MKPTNPCPQSEEGTAGETRLSSPWYSFNQQAYPGPAPCFYPAERFPELAIPEPDWTAIVEEVTRFLEANPRKLQPYFQPKMAFPPGEWKTTGFLFWSMPFPENLAQCPRLAARLDRIPRLVSAAVSVLEPETKILPHFGDTDAIIRVHLPLRVPAPLPDCGFQVGEEARSWVEGQPLAFTDAHLHMAWNYTKERRTILIFDLMRPEFVRRQRSISARVLAAMFLTTWLPAIGKAPAFVRHLLWFVAAGPFRLYLFLRRRSHV